MKRSTLLIALAAPLMLGAALPPERPALPGRSAEIVEVNVIDRFLKDTGIRKQSSTREKARTRSRNTSRNSIPKPPPLASVPLPIPKPTETAQKLRPEPPLPTDKPVEAADPKPEEQTAPPETNNAENKPVQSDLAKPDEKAASSPAKPEKEDQAKPPVIEQPSTATEPAREAEAPTPLPKPEPDTVTAKPDNAERGSPEKPAESQPAQAEVKPDGKPDEAGETEKAETPPPPPLEKDNPQELQACLADLKAIGAKFETNDPIDDGNGCGIEHPIDVAEVLPGVDLGGATMRCKTALTMAHWLKDTVQPAMTIAMPGRRIVGLVPGSTYQCRLRNSAATGKISEHARGNAYDVAAFKLDNGEKIEMKPRTEDSTLEGAFQRTATAGACLHFTTVLSPGSDASHEDHLHLDILERNGGYRYCR